MSADEQTQRAAPSNNQAAKAAAQFPQRKYTANAECMTANLRIQKNVHREHAPAET
jgi:hypothetical protein